MVLAPQPLRVLARSAPCLLTAGLADRTLRAVERDLLQAAADLAQPVASLGVAMREIDMKA